MKNFMHNRINLCFLMLIPLSATAQDQDLLFTGRVFSQKAQEIFVPLTNNWQARISRMLPEGTQVQPGDVAVEFDGSEAARQLEQLMESQRTEQAKTERDTAISQKEQNVAEFQLEQTRVDLALAELRAGIPEGLIGGIEYAVNQLASEKGIKGV